MNFRRLLHSKTILLRIAVSFFFVTITMAVFLNGIVYSIELFGDFSLRAPIGTDEKRTDSALNYFGRDSKKPFIFAVNEELVNRSLEESFGFKYLSPRRKSEAKRRIMAISNIPIFLNRSILKRDVEGYFDGDRILKEVTLRLYGSAPSTPDIEDYPIRIVSLSSYIEEYVKEREKKGFKLIRISLLGSWVARARHPQDIDLMLEFSDPSKEEKDRIVELRLDPSGYPEDIDIPHRKRTMSLIINFGRHSLPGTIETAYLESITLVGQYPLARLKDMPREDVFRYLEFQYYKRNLRIEEWRFAPPHIACDGLTTKVARSSFVLEQIFPKRGFASRANGMLNAFDRYFDAAESKMEISVIEKAEAEWAKHLNELERMIENAMVSMKKSSLVYPDTMIITIQEVDALYKSL